MQVLVTGADGQLGYEACAWLKKQNIACLGTTSCSMDITDAQVVQQQMEQYHPDAVIHCAAYTKVDAAEEEPELAFAVNGQGTRNIAHACRVIDAKLLFVSTDYVFEGRGLKCYRPDDPVLPQNVYGASKLAGEKAVQEIWDRAFIVRTSWVFSHRKNNFVKTMLRLSENHKELRVVADQVGSPTLAADLAELLGRMIQTERFGIYHATNEGTCSWAAFAEEIFRQADRGVKVIPVSTQEYGAKAKRPQNSRLDKSCLEQAGFDRLPDWQSGLARCLDALHACTERSAGSE